MIIGSSLILMEIHGITGVGWGWLGSQSLVAAFLLLAILRPLIQKKGILWRRTYPEQQRDQVEGEQS
jgi:hypothetical protein